VSKEKRKFPDWCVNDLVAPFRSGVANLFIVHGDINGLIPNPNSETAETRPYRSLSGFLSEIFREREIVVFYNLASGLTFSNRDMEEAFKKAAGIESDDRSAGGDPIAAAKADLRARRGIPREPEACLPLIEKVLNKESQVAVIMESIHLIAPVNAGGISLPMAERANIERLKNWARDRVVKKNNNIIVCLTDQASKVSLELRNSGNGVRAVLIPKPGRDDRETFIKITADLSGVKGADKKPLAHVTQGLNLRQIEEIFLQCRNSGKLIDVADVKARKRQILNEEYGDVMEIVEPERGLDDIGGLEHIKDYFRGVLAAIKSGEARLVPMGVTLMGPPGTGKTAVVEALAREAGFNFIKTKNIRSMWVGESEARMEKLLYGLRSLAPVVVMNDEADLAEAGRDSYKGDSGVSERIMKMWMELLSDPRIRGQIIVISCTNRPDRIDAALKRSGRSDDRILLPMPSQTEREAIFAVMFKRHKIPTSVKNFGEFAKRADGISGADIEKITLSSYRFANRNGKKEVDETALKEAIADFIPSASQKEIDFMTLMGIVESSSRRLLPANVKETISQIRVRNLVENLEEIVAQIEARRIVPPDISLNLAPPSGVRAN